MLPVDLHVHSNYSDGTYSPRELVDYAMEKGLSAFALTDHDTVDGLPEALEYARSLREALPEDQKDTVPEIVPGIELSTDENDSEVHVVGLYIDSRNKEFREYLKEFMESRDTRNRKMCEKLREYGLDVTYEALLERFPNCVLTRAHYARYLLEKGCVKSIREAFDRFLGNRCPCYLPREKITPAKAVELILKAGGIPVLAHPILYRMSDARLDDLVGRLKAVGLMGVEAVYSSYTPSEERQIRRLAKKHHLLISGGSDFHGENKPKLDLAVGYGKLYVPDEVLLDLKKAMKNLLFTDLDGTLLLSDSTVSPAMKQALDRMAAAGHRLILSSGRPLPSVLEIIRDNHLDYPDMLVISYNGGCIYDCARKTVLSEMLLTPETISETEGLAKEAGLHLHAYTPDAANAGIVCRRINDEIRFYTRRIHLPVTQLDEIGVGSLAEYLSKGCHKLQVISLERKDALEAFRQKLQDTFGDRLSIFFSNDKYLEIMPGGAGKDLALRYIAELFHTHPHHTFAAGDAENDIGMLRAAHVGIAMKNAAPSVKDAADLVTEKTNDEDGLKEILDRYFI